MPTTRSAIHSTNPPGRAAVLRGARAALGFGAISLSAVAGATWWLFVLPASYLVQVAALYVAMSGVVARGASRHGVLHDIGMANRITLARATLVLPVAGLVLHPGIPPVAYWWVVFWATIAMGLDGLDGRVARRTGTTSSFGARFDMEVDSFLILVLSTLVWQSGKLGPWVLWIGALRYLFVAAGWIWPALRGELPESQRRKTACVLQGLVLLVCGAPITPSILALILAGAALVLLVYSFGVDVAWLARVGRDRSLVR